MFLKSELSQDVLALLGLRVLSLGLSKCFNFLCLVNHIFDIFRAFVKAAIVSFIVALVQAEDKSGADDQQEHKDI